MIHIPRPTIPGAVLVIGLAAALVAPGATGHSQAAPSMQQEPFISGPYLVQVGTTHPGPQGRLERQGADHLLVPVDALQPGCDGLQPGVERDRQPATRSSTPTSGTRSGSG